MGGQRDKAPRPRRIRLMHVRRCEDRDSVCITDATYSPVQQPGPTVSSARLHARFPGPEPPRSASPHSLPGRPERIANGPRIASATAGHSASIPSSLSAVRIFLFNILARHAEPLNKIRCWRTRIAQLAHTRCAPIRHSHAHSGGNRGVHLSGHALRQRFRKDRARCGGVRSDSSPNPRAHLRAHGCCQETDARVHDVQTSRDCLCAPGSSSGARLPHGFVIHNGVGDERTAFALGGAHP